jgi:hypothetical protein
MPAFLLTLLIFVNMYTPYSLWVGVATNILLAIYVVLTMRQYAKVTKFEIAVIALSSSIFVWSIATSIANDTLSSYVIGRFGRIVLNTVLISFIIRNAHFSFRSFITATGITLIINVLVVYIQWLYPASKDYFLNIAEFTKEIRGNLRAFGLYASFDSCGLNIIAGMAFWGILFYYYRTKLFILFLLLAFTSTLFVSRTTMIVAGVFLLIIYLFIFKISKKYFILLGLLYIPIGIYFYRQAILFLDLNSYYYIGYDAERSYAKYSLDVLTGRMFFFPQDILNLFFGEGIEPDSSDIGYIKLIFMIGIFGLLIIMFLYLYIIFFLNKKIKNDNNRENRMILYFSTALFIAMLIFNFKLLLLYGRGFHDIFILMCFTLNKFLNEKSQFQYI